MQIGAMDNTENFLQQLHAAGEIEDSKIPLAETALVLAALDHTKIDLTPYRAHLAQLADDARAQFTELRRGMTLGEAAARSLADTIAARHRYVGDNATFDDPQNADLVRVIDRRRGLPVALGIIYIDVAHRIGVHSQGLNTPGHFLLSLGEGDHAKIVDPFNGGVALSVDDLRPMAPAPQGEFVEYGPVTRRDVLLRLLNNIRTRALAGKDMIRAQIIAERMVVIAPRHPELWLDLSKANEAVGKMNGAILAAQRCIALAGADTTLGREAVFAVHGLKRMVN